MLTKNARKCRLIYVAGKMQTRRWRREGEDSDCFSTEILLVTGSSSWIGRGTATVRSRRKPSRLRTVRPPRPAAPRHRSTTWTRFRSDLFPLSPSVIGASALVPFHFAVGFESAPSATFGGLRAERAGGGAKPDECEPRGGTGSPVRRLDRAIDRVAPEMRDLERTQDGTEINARELQLVTKRARNLGDRRDAFEDIRDAAAEQYRAETGEVWRSRRGSYTSQTGKLTSAAIDARDFLRARKDREMRAHSPNGTLVAIVVGRDVADPGVEKLTAQWAERNGVHQIVCKPDWNAHGRAAPFRRNDELLNLLPKGVIAFPDNGITENLVDKAVKLGIPMQRVAA